MTTALWCVFISGLLPVLCTAIAKWGLRDFDNYQPREWLARQQGWRARANAAQQNSWEAFAFFAVAVLSAHIVQGESSAVNTLALSFLMGRLLYVFCYVRNLAALRSIVWLLCMICAASIFLLAARVL
jgi:uncharacterized MAPEG superfamily protein